MRIISLSGGNGWHIQDLERASRITGDEWIACSWRHLTGSLCQGEPTARCGQTIVDEADALLLRTMPPGSLEQIIFRMDLVQRLFLSGVMVVNPPRAVEAAVDKYLALARLTAAGLPTPATIACQRFADAMDAFERLGRDVVVKPLFGSEGFGIQRLTDPDLAARTFATLERLTSVIYLQQFIPHDGSDLRLFVLGDRVLACMRRCSADFRTNIARGATGESFEPTDELTRLALQTSRACGAWIAGVDIVIDPRDGQPYVLEANAVPGWRGLAQVTGVDVAVHVLQALRQWKTAPPRGDAALD